MNEDLRDLPIGVFDSGLGGISVLADLIHQLPYETYIYFGDSGNAPYGIRSKDEVKKLSFHVVDSLLRMGIKAIVVACNTATSVVIEDLRQKLHIPVIGMEPALKPAIELNLPGKIVVMATPVTLREEKFNNLIEKFKGRKDIIKMPCPGLVEIIEKYGNNTKEIDDYIQSAFSSYNLEEVGAIVLGCTHYLFIREKLQKTIGGKISIVDGNLGTARHTRHLLEEHNTINRPGLGSPKETKVKIINSSQDPNMMVLSKKLLEERLNDLNHCGSIQYI